MRTILSPLLSRGRVHTGPMATTDAEGLVGAFFVTAPTGRHLRIIASDGRLWREEGMPGVPWEHVSVSLPERAERCPTWEEMCWVKNLFWTEDEVVMQLHPAKADYVNTHAGCLHLWRPVGAEIPLPPRECV